MSMVKFCEFSFIVYAMLLCQNFKVNGIGCGKITMMIPLVRDGNVTNRDQWPFVAALYKVSSAEYFCGGTLISERHVLTG